MGHTPGPWYANQDCIEIDGPEGPRDVTLAVVLQPDNAAADARLIAAAPEMLDALRLAADAIDLAQAQVDSENDRYNLCKRLVAVKRVIAKAEGRE